MTTTELPIRNGNKFVKLPHVFVSGIGCFFASEATAIKEGTSPNGAGLWTETLQFEGATYYRAGNLNAWD